MADPAIIGASVGAGIAVVTTNGNPAYLQACSAGGKGGTHERTCPERATEHRRMTGIARRIGKRYGHER